MIKLPSFSFAVLLTILVSSFSACSQNQEIANNQNEKIVYKISKTEDQWKEVLTDEEYKVLREKETEPAFSNEYNANKKKGTYLCAACEQPLFSSKAKFDSGTGWPSFFAPLEKNSVKEVLDKSYGMIRTEVVCSNCGGHLGHLFTDGPEPTGLRYCLNSVSLDFKKEK